MGLEMGMGYYQEQRQHLGHEQKIQLRQMQEVSLELRHESFGEAVRGIEGLQAADAILKEKNLRGLLIGGLSEDVWNPRHTKKDLAEHKDVDILVPDIPEGSEISALEGGIDWWLPKDAKLKVQYESGSSEGLVRFWENEFGIRLSFGVDAEYMNRHPVGLYIPTAEFIEDMRVAELAARLDPRVGTIDSEVEEVFRDKLRKKLKDELVGAVGKNFATDTRSVFKVKRFDYQTSVAVNSATEEQITLNREYVLPDPESLFASDQYLEDELERFDTDGIKGERVGFDIYDDSTGEIILPANKVVTDVTMHKLLVHIANLQWGQSIEWKEGGKPKLVSFLETAYSNFKEPKNKK